jgi:acyl carrier protein
VSKLLEDVIAETLRISPSAVTDALAFNGIPQWDSLAHVELMVALESTYGVTVDEDQMVDLMTVADIRSYLRQHGH